MLMETNWERLNYKNENILRNNSDIEELNMDKIICVLCGGLQEDGKPHIFVQKRLDKAYEIYQNNKDAIILILGGGTYHKPPYMNKDCFAVHESSSCAKYLYERGVNSKHIFREWSSYDTIANGFFAFTNYLNNLNVSKMILITSEFHMDRSKTIFNYFNKLFNRKIDIKYIETESFLPLGIYNIRFERERKSKENFEQNIVNKIKTIKGFIEWFYTEHKAYKSILEYESVNINSDTKKTY